MTKSIKYVIIVLLIGIMSWKVGYDYNINQEIDYIKNYYSLYKYDQEKFNLKRISLKALIDKINKQSEEYFILGFYEKERGNKNKSEKYFDLATEKIDKIKNKFIKYYL